VDAECGCARGSFVKIRGLTRTQNFGIRTFLTDCTDRCHQRFDLATHNSRHKENRQSAFSKTLTRD